MATSLLPASTSYFFPFALSLSFFPRFLSYWPTFRILPLKYILKKLLMLTYDIGGTRNFIYNLIW
jgi:hypothetical protein